MKDEGRWAKMRKTWEDLNIFEFLILNWKLSTLIRNYSDVLAVMFFSLKELSMEWIRFYIFFGQDWQDYIDIKAFGLNVSRRRRKKSHWSCKPCLIFFLNRIHSSGLSITVFMSLCTKFEWVVKRSKSAWLGCKEAINLWTLCHRSNHPINYSTYNSQNTTNHIQNDRSQRPKSNLARGDHDQRAACWNQGFPSLPRSAHWRYLCNTAQFWKNYRPGQFPGLSDSYDCGRMSAARSPF